MPCLQGQDLEKQQAEHAVEEALAAAILLDRCPKSLIEVQCLVIESGGSVVAALLMAAGLAVMDAQIEMRCMLSAACVVRSQVVVTSLCQ
jgi:ribonuclease PH